MAIGNYVLSDFEYGCSHNDESTRPCDGDPWALISAKRARSKAQWKTLMARCERRMGKREILAELADQAADDAVSGPGLGDAWLLDRVAKSNLLLIDGDDDLQAFLDALDSLAGSTYETDDEGWLDDLGVERYTDLLDDDSDDDEPLSIDQSDVDAAGGWGTTLELARNSEEYVVNDGFVITSGDFYRRGEGGIR